MMQIRQVPSYRLSPLRAVSLLSPVSLTRPFFLPAPIVFEFCPMELYSKHLKIPARVFPEVCGDRSLFLIFFTEIDV